MRVRHGMSGIPEYFVWGGMIQRCTNPKNAGFPAYGGRGIQVCDRWRTSFANFLEDVKQRPSSKHSLDRYPDNNGNYEPGNVRWATSREQNLNKRTNVVIVIDGEAVSLKALYESRKTKRSPAYATFFHRVRSGISVDRALSAERHGRRYFAHVIPPAVPAENSLISVDDHGLFIIEKFYEGYAYDEIGASLGGLSVSEVENITVTLGLPSQREVQCVVLRKNLNA